MVFRCKYVVEIVDESVDRSTAGYIFLLIRGIEDCKKADRDLTWWNYDNCKSKY